MLEATKSDNGVGQLIFDINGEYANDNPQDGNRSIRSAYESRCQGLCTHRTAVYAVEAASIEFFTNSRIRALPSSDH